MHKRFSLWVPCVLAILAPLHIVLAAGLDEFKIKREQVFEFAEKPQVTRKGDKVTVSFATRGFCDVTVAVEKDQGKIIRHLACGVLGPKAPAPFTKNSKKQTIVWDGKDDQGRYIDDKDACVVRVSLGLKPRLERTLDWHPHELARFGKGPGDAMHSPFFAARPEGVYVYQGSALDHVRLFDHDGNYIRTIYPFPKTQWPRVKGLATHVFPHDGQRLPLKGGFHQATLLTCGSNHNIGSYSDNGVAAYAMAVHGNTLVLLHQKSNWLSLDGSERELVGPQTGIIARRGVIGTQGKWSTELIPPRSAAFSPDGRWLYYTGFGWYNGWLGRGCDWMHAVMRVRADGGAKPEVFSGSSKQGDKGNGPSKLHVPTSVACDGKGRVYVADNQNNRVQVFSEAGKLLKSIAVDHPVHVAVHHKTGEIYVFSWYLITQARGANAGWIPPKLTRFGPLENPKQLAVYPLPLVKARTYRLGGQEYRVELDSWAAEPTIWLVAGAGQHKPEWAIPQLLVVRNGKLEVKRRPADEVKRAIASLQPHQQMRQRLYVNPANHRLYIAEAFTGGNMGFMELREVDPESGKVKLRNLPFDAEDMCFDANGHAYLRTDNEIVRYDPRSWREIPWDYGEERAGVAFAGTGGRGRETAVVSALVVPGHYNWFGGGMAINTRGHLVITTHTAKNKPSEHHVGHKTKATSEGAQYTPKLYPGRFRWGEIHVYDKHGKVIHEDAFPGIGHMDGIGIDWNDNIYCMAASRRIIDGKIYDPGLRDDLSETLMKVAPGKAKLITSGRSPVPLAKGAGLKRSRDISGSPGSGGGAWVEGADWLYGGVGFNGKIASWAMGGCCCWAAARFTLDYYGRSFAPEPRHFSVAVLDSSGNLILRVGRYGNVDDGMPLVKDGGPPNPRSIGGDEVGLFHACYVGTDTDRRLFIADAGNARIVSVKLGYHAEAKVALKDVRDRTNP